MKLLSDSASIQRLFIDEFAPHADFIGDCIIQFFESLMAADNCENLRGKSVLNPTSDGDAMSLPASLLVRITANIYFIIFFSFSEEFLLFIIVKCSC